MAHADEQLIEASRAGNTKQATAALQAGADARYREPKFGGTAFQYAARSGHLDLAKLLLDHGADLHTKNSRGETPLFEVVESNCGLGPIEFLLDRGVGVDVANNDGWTPLMAACTWDERWNDVVRLLIDRGADVNHVALDDWTPLLLACNNHVLRGGPESILFASRKLDVNVVTRQYGWTPLLHAAAGTSLDSVKMLLQRGADVHAQMKVAATKPFLAKTSLRAKNLAGAIKAKREHDGFTALHWAVLKRRRCRQLLLDAGADPDATSSDGRTPRDMGLPIKAPAKIEPTSNEAALLAAIAANLADDAPRLVYADWLLDHGNAWGEVIHLAIKARALRAGSAERAAADAELAKLEKKHSAQFLQPIAKFVRQPRFDRGMIRELACDAQLFTQAAEAIADRAPRATLQITGMKPKLLGAFMSAPLARFACLQLDENRLDDAALERFAECANLAGVKRLHLTRNTFTDRGANALAASKYLSELMVLTVGGHVRLTSSAVRTLVSSPQLQQLQSLTVACGGEGLGAAIAACTLPIVQLNLVRVTDFDDADAERVANAKGLSKLEELCISSTTALDVTDAGAKALLGSAKFKLTHLVLEQAPSLSAAMTARLRAMGS